MYKSSKRISPRTYYSPNKKKIIENIQKAKKIVVQKCSRASKKILRLQKSLNNCRKLMNEMSNSRLSKLLEDHTIPKSQSELIHEIFAASKFKNTKNRRYSENWTLLCLLFQIR